MNGSDTRQRRRLIERLNAKEAELSKSQGEKPQPSKKELEDRNGEGKAA